jgi:hypothetical protein
MKIVAPNARNMFTPFFVGCRVNSEEPNNSKGTTK